MVDPLPLTQQSRLVLKELTVVPDDNGEHLVGDPQTGVFVALPTIGVTVIDQLRGGATLGMAGQVASVDAGEEVDAVDFGETLVELGFVAAVDGRPVAPPPDAPTRRWIAGVRPELARPLFAPLAWLCYGLLFVGCAVLMVARPAYRPAADDLYFLSSPVVSLGVLAVWAMFSTAGHEIAHWLAARAEGVPARFSIGRRLYFLVFETDLTQLWGLPRRRRFAPLLAGLAYDTVVLSGLLAVQLISADEFVDRVTAALVAVEISGILFQFLVFLRTDLYAVLVMLFGCRDLWRVNTLELRRMFGRLDEPQAAELAKAHPRDRRVANWFRWLSIAGFAAAAWYFVAFVVPALWTLLGWITESLSTAAPTTGRFWQSVIFAVLALAPMALLLGVTARERLRRHYRRSR
ncbi:MAG TPA: hypothetical protein VH969_19160 [Actinophytocola sp.]|jgi:hypothetical protein|uniref:hypothetical protein n=1 Tax=Actinophytocola sp. TaxID=1872138 RepID=UPI002F927329